METTSVVNLSALNSTAPEGRGASLLTLSRSAVRRPSRERGRLDLLAVGAIEGVRFLSRKWGLWC